MQILIKDCYFYCAAAVLVVLLVHSSQPLVVARVARQTQHCCDLSCDLLLPLQLQFSKCTVCGAGWKGESHHVALKPKFTTLSWEPRIFHAENLLTAGKRAAGRLVTGNRRRPRNARACVLSRRRDALLHQPKR